MGRLMLAILIALCATPTAGADTGPCYSIGDADARNYCIAKAKNERSICYTIQKGEMRAQCLAEVG